MICYRDRTYCPYTTCANKTCERRLTEEIRAAAREWWGSDDAPIAVYGDRPECYKEAN